MLKGYFTKRRTVAIATVLAVAACAGIAVASSSAASASSITVLIGAGPNSLDPGLAVNTQSVEMFWITNTGLLTYKHLNGEQGNTLIPGLATALPVISDGGKRYTLTLRKGLEFSDGTPVTASDFAYTYERALKLNGTDTVYLTSVVGASAYQAGKASTLAGITTDDATGNIVITLTSPQGSFSNTLALPTLGLVPSSTPMTTATSPPPGVGPYKFSTVNPGVSWTLVRNPLFASFHIPGIPTGYINTVTFQLTTNNASEAEELLQNQADVFDWRDTLPPELVSQIKAQAADRYALHIGDATYYFWLNSRVAPFTSLKVRQAINYALDRRALSRLTGGFMAPQCYFLPAGFPGHPTKPCPFASASWVPNVAKAKQLVKQSGFEGAPVTIWGESNSPRKEWVEYAATVLDAIGLKATPKFLSDTIYYQTIGNISLHAQMGTADWEPSAPQPSLDYVTYAASGILPTNNVNLAEEDNPHIQSALNALTPLPITDPKAIAGWQALDYYAAVQSYYVSYGSLELPQFYSNRINFKSAIFSPVYGTDFSSLRLN